MKRFLTLALAICLALGACAVPAAARSSEELEPIVIKVLAQGDAQRSSLEDEVGRLIYDELKIEIEFVPFNESNYEKALMMLAAQNWGDLDLVCTALDDTTAKYIAADAFVNLDDYRDQMPNFYEYCADLIPYWRNYDAENGNLYVWQPGPDQLQMTQPCLDIVVRTDALEALGWPDLDTTADYVDFLKQAMQMFPESNGQPTIGMSSFWGDAVGPLVTTYLPRHSGYSHPYKIYSLIDVESERFISGIDHPYYYESAKFFNTLWREGILDSEVFSDDMNMCQAKLESGVPLSVWFMNWGTTTANQYAIERGQEDAQYIVMPVRLQIAKDEGRDKRYEIYTSYRVDSTFGILKTSPHAERICQMIDFVSTPEMTARCGWGLEGRDYTVDEDGKFVCSEEFLSTMAGAGAQDYKLATGINSFYSQLFPIRSVGLMQNGQAGTYANDPAFKMAAATAREKEAYAHLGWQDNTSGWTDNPHFEFIPFDLSLYQAAVTLDAESEEAKIETRVTDYLNGAIAKLICCESEEAFEAQYREMCKMVEEMGVSQVTDKYNQQYQEITDRIEQLKAR